MSSAPPDVSSVPAFADRWGHPRPLWMLFMAEFWERFAYYGIRWALTLYIVSEFFGGHASGQGYASGTFGAYTALVYASAIFGGYVADRVIGAQRSILLGAVIMGAGLFLIAVPNQQVFLLGLATIVVGNGLFKPNISSLVGKLYAPGDPRRDRGFSIFYMGINLGGALSPLVTQMLASAFSNDPALPSYKVVFITAGIGMMLSYVWFWFGRRQLDGIGLPPETQSANRKLLAVIAIALVAIFPVYLLMAYVGAKILAWALTCLLIALGVMLVRGAWHLGKVSRERVIAANLMFFFNVAFWTFFEQAGSSVNFLTDTMVDRGLLGTAWEVPTAWFQSINSAVIVMLAPVLSLVWMALAKVDREPSIPRKFALGLLGNAAGFILLVVALMFWVDDTNKIPFAVLIGFYALQTVGELCLSPIGLSMVTKLVPGNMFGLAMGGWFLSTAVGNNLAGLVASFISGESGMTLDSAIDGFSFAIELLVVGGVLLFAIGPLIAKLMHGVK